MSRVEERKRVLAIVAGTLVARHLKTADDLFGGSQGSPRTDKMIAAAILAVRRLANWDGRPSPAFESAIGVTTCRRLATTRSGAPEL